MIHNSHSVNGVQRNLDPDKARTDSRLGLVLGLPIAETHLLGLELSGLLA